MINLSCSAAAMATSAVVQAAQLLLSDLEHGRRIDAAGTLRAAMQTAFSASDASCAWHWKAAYDACEAATVLFLRKYASSMRAKAGSPALLLSMLAKVAGLLPTQSRRSEQSKALEQFSTPVPVGFDACGQPALRRRTWFSSPLCATACALMDCSVRSSPGSGACSYRRTRGAGVSMRRCSNAIPLSASASGRRRDGARCFRVGTSSRARGRGGVPSLSLQWTTGGPLLAGGRR